MIRPIMLAAVALLCVSMTARAQGRSRMTRADSAHLAPATAADSAVLALTLDAATRVVTPYTSGDTTRTPGAWVFEVAPGMAGGQGARIADQLRRQFALRDTTRRDSARTIVMIQQPRITADSFSVSISVGNWVSCPSPPSATVQSTFEISGVHRTDGWTWSRPWERSRSIAIACPVAQPLIELPVPLTGRVRFGRGGRGGTRSP